MIKRSEFSENLLVAMSIFVFLLLFVCPGVFFLFFLPAWLGFPIALACGSIGPWLLWKADEAAYGKRS